MSFADIPNRPFYKKTDKDVIDLKGSITITNVTLLKNVYTPIRFLFWVNGGYSDVLYFQLNVDVDKNIMQVDNIFNQSEKGIQINIGKTTMYLDAKYPTSRLESCECEAEVIIPPWLCFEIFVPTKLDEQDKETKGWVLLGGYHIPLSEKSNYYEETEFKLYNFHMVADTSVPRDILDKLGSITIAKRISNETKWKNVREDLCWQPKINNEYIQKEQELLFSAPKHESGVILNREYIQIESVYTIGRHGGVVPRSLFHWHVGERFKCTDRWCEAWLRFSFKLRELTLKDLNECANCTSESSKPEKWEDVVSAIIFAFTLKETNFNYQPDAIFLQTGESIAYEFFNDKITSIFGTGDCEDFAFNLLGAYRYLQDREPNDTFEFCNKAQIILKNYVITNALVHALQPCLTLKYDSSSSVVYFHETDFDLSLNIQQEAIKDRRMRNYHMTCLLIPKSYIHKLYDEAPFTTDELTFDMNVQLAEGTSSIYSDLHKKILNSKEDIKPIMIAMSEGKVPLCGLTCENYPQTANIMIGAIIEFCTDYFINEDENKRITLFECWSEIEGKWIKGIQELVISSKNLDKLKLTAGVNTPPFSHDADLNIILDLEMPPVIYDIPEEKYLNTIEDINKIKLTKPNEFIFATVTNDGGIPISPWNDTWGNTEPKKYISII